jgi:hypothetical protein
VPRRGLELIEAQLDEAYRMLRSRLDGLTDQEFAWEPAPGAWTVHPDDRGMWIADYAEPDPVPAPITTIGWRVVHISDCKLMYHEYAFGPGERQWPDLEADHTAEAALRSLEERHATLAGAAASLEDDAELDVIRMTNWGEPWPTWRILWTLVHHDLWHGGEIGALRDLYRFTTSGA